MTDELKQKLGNYVEDAIDLRFSFELPEFGDGPVELHNALVQSQEILTKLEQLLSKALREKGPLDRKQAHVKMVWQEAFDRGLTKKNVGFGTDFVSGKEKSAEANLAAFNEARTLRNIEELQSFAHDAVDIIRLHYYGMDKVRQDIRKRLDMSQTDFYSS